MNLAQDLIPHVPDCVHELVEAQVVRTPEAIAAVSNNQHITYQALEARGNQLAHYLRRHGVGPETRVGVCLERSLDLVISLLGILKAGGAYVPVDPDLPPRRVAFMVEDSSASILLTQEGLMKVRPDLPIDIICLDKDWGKVVQESNEAPLNTMNPESLAYVIYTSGSTGQPKGVGISHKALNNFLIAFQSNMGFSSEDGWLAVTTISFDMAVSEIWLPLMVGAEVCVAPKDSTNDGKKLAKLIDESNATVMQGTPATWQMLIEADWKGGPLLKIVCGGDALSHLLANNLLARGSEVWNSYGLTEATVWSCASRMLAGNGTVSIGAPLANTEFFILNECGSPVPMGIPGELYIGGTSLAQGYMKRPDLTAEKFIPNPWSPVPSARLYRTGDLVRSRDDGKLEFLGRWDHQVKVRGFRIELGEIETALCRHPAVQQAVVIAQSDELNEKQLVAYVILEREKEMTHDDLRESLKDHLPAYMIPGLFVPLDAFPLTPNGKIDRKSLPSPDSVPLMLTEEFVAPRTQIEITLERIWSEALGLHNLGMHDNFFELGGHSLFATQIVSRVRERFNQELPITQLFVTPTIAAMARLIGEPNTEDSTLPIPPIKPAPRHESMPLSCSQERVWFIQHLNEGMRAYQFQCAIRFKGQLDVDSLKKSLNAIVHRHEIYRTTFPLGDVSAIQAVHPFQPFDLPVFTIEGSSREEQEIFVREKITEELEIPFDLQQQPLIRWTLLKLGELDHVLIHVEHHMVHDGWSFHVFIRELLELYRAFTQDRPVSLPELPIQFVDFSWWERNRIENGHFHSQIDYWKDTLFGCPSSLKLPYDYPRPRVQSFNGAAPRVELSPRLSKAVRQFSRQEKTTLFMSMFTAFVGLLYRYTGQDDLCIGTAIGNRRLRECEDVIGMIVNNVVLRVRNVGGNLSARELLEQVRVVTQEAYDHQDIPFDHVVRVVQPERDPSRNPLFQTTFNFHDTPLPKVQFPELTVSLLEGISNNTSKFDLSVIVIPWSNKDYATIPNTGDDGITLIWEYNTDLFESKTITQMMESYQTFLNGMLANPDQQISTLPLLTDFQVTQQVVEWNNTRRNYPRDATLPQLFEQQVERSPDAVAVVFEDHQVTYRELNGRANQLAHYLRRQGVGPEVRVGVCLERSVELIVSLVAIGKAGGAYVFLEPTFPPERLTLMMTDAQVNLVLTQKAHVPSLPQHNIPVIPWETLSSELIPQFTINPQSSLSPMNLAYLSFTSGSTGRPKGIAISHGALHNHMAWMQTTFAFTPETRVLQKTSLSFDASVWEYWMPLLTGGQVVLAENEDVRDFAQLVQRLQRHQITHLQMVPSTLTLLLQEPELPRCRSLRHLFSGGEPLFPKLQEQCFQILPWTLHNLYGPAENTINVTAWTCQPTLRSTSVPIGYPITNAHIYLLDQFYSLVPIGVVGELLVGGTPLGRGYWRQPALTAERFQPDPFSLIPGERLYRTGDLARHHSNGVLEHVGRVDHQIKLRGIRMELGEIEAVLNNHPEVRRAIVLCREDTPGEKHLVAYVTGDHEGSARPDLRAYLTKQLPEYMIPQAFVFLDALPLTPNGKLDRLALAAPDHSIRAEGTNYVAPRTVIEELLVKVWQEVLKVEDIGIHDNFFNMGGHSLLAMQMMTRLQNLLEIHLPLRLFFENPILGDLAKEIDAQFNKAFPDGPKDPSEAEN